MKKLLLITILLGYVHCAHSQQMFTQIPHRDYAYVYQAAEIGNSYYFFSNQSFYINNVLSGGNYIHKTDVNSNIVDSLLLTHPSIPGVFSIGQENDTLNIYTARGSERNFLGYAAKFSLGSMRYDSNFKFIDSFMVDIPQSAFLAGSIWYSKRIKDRIIYVVQGRDTLLNAPFQTQQDKIFVLDTHGNFLFEKVLIDSLAHKFTDITTTNDGENFIVRLSGYFRMYNDSFNNTKLALEPMDYYPGFNGLDKYDADKFTMGFIKGGNPSVLYSDSFCVDLRDTNFNLLKQRCIPRHAVLNNYPFNYNGFDTRWYDGTNKDNIYIGNNWGSGGAGNSYFSLSNLDSNLNIRWSKVFGGDYPYQIEQYTSTSDGGCFMMGIRVLGNTQQSTIEPVVFKVSQAGAITSITSLAPSAQAFFSSYPNPTTGFYSIKNSSHTPYELLVLSADGKVILNKKNIQATQYEIDLSAVVNGIYFYKIFTQDGQSAGGKFLKK